MNPPEQALMAKAGERRPGGGLWHRLGRQLARPQGRAGALAGHLMAWVNRRPNALAIAALEVRPDDHVLEIGFGPGDGLAMLARQAGLGLIHGIDGSPAMLAQATRRNAQAIAEGRMRLATGDMRRLPFPDASFDKVLGVNVAYFFDPDGAAVAEIHRVLRPGGRVALYVTDRATMAGWPFADPRTHVTYDWADLKHLIADGGFEPARVMIRALDLPLGVKGLIATARR